MQLMFKSLHTYLPGSLEFLFGRFRSSNRPSLSPLPPRPSARRPRQLIVRINTIPTEILLEIFLFIVSASLSDHESCFESRHSSSSFRIPNAPRPPSIYDPLTYVTDGAKSCSGALFSGVSFPIKISVVKSEWMRILPSRLWRVSPHSRPLSHPRKENDNDNDTSLLTIRFRICSRL
ncbi:hypothetical protein M378DRAFT_354975 [Amanita muscaria Koide BX008]|uniref:Uncharacterized protein n=1 Tax=Amanita muscaria (strain Koide BX008) TaxID=946122 RepID=A0A0C2TIW0_AMAMK|nr:hypothetical protein M378DRAFT_354975 [Amanita muscaria Koide BX008]